MIANYFDTNTNLVNTYMKNTYMYKNLKVIDLLIEKPKYSKKRLVFLLEDGTKVYA